MTVVEETEDYVTYDENTLVHIHKVLLMVLEDFINICEENNIEYFCGYGTAIGAVRHHGFIPWDDDLDVLMFREEYEKFYEIMKNKTEKYEILNIENEGFFRFLIKLNLKHTICGEPWDINTDFTLGLGLDIFILDNIPNNNLKKAIFKKKVLILKKLNILLLTLTNDRFYTKNREKIGHALKKMFNIIGINQNFVIKQYNKLNSYPQGDEVCDLSAQYRVITHPTKLFSPPKKIKFESLMVNVPNDYDTYLKIIYGDYMKMPPKEERVNHGLEIDFGPY